MRGDSAEIICIRLRGGVVLGYAKKEEINGEERRGEDTLKE